MFTYVQLSLYADINMKSKKKKKKKEKYMFTVSIWDIGLSSFKVLQKKSYMP